MARPPKRRRVCGMPRHQQFGPPGCCSQPLIEMALEEFETIRLIDYEGLTQAECAQQMDVARTTVQAIYAEARRKLADSLVNGKSLVIQGGAYQICENDDIHKGCQHHGCKRRGHGGRHHHERCREREENE